MRFFEDSCCIRFCRSEVGGRNSREKHEERFEGGIGSKQLLEKHKTRKRDQEMDQNIRDSMKWEWRGGHIHVEGRKVQCKKHTLYSLNDSSTPNIACIHVSMDFIEWNHP